jgi:hypothetical protein
VLAGEAARLADRLDGLNQLLSGDIDTWVRLREIDGTDVANLVIDSAAAEARQTANTLRLLLGQLTGAAAPAEGGGTLADELAKRRADRSSGT